MTAQEYINAYHRRLARLERKYAPRVYRALMAQMKRFTDGLKEGRTNVELINPEIATVLRQMHIEGGISEGRLAYKMLRDDTGLKRLGNNEEWTNDIINRLARHNAQFVVSITETTREYITRMLQEGLRDGLTYQEIADKITIEVQQSYRYRSEAIARTELNRAANLGNVLAAEKYPYLTEKLWITAKDHRVRGQVRGERFNHVVLDGKKVDSDEPFNNGEDIMQPGDASASPGNTINCRCTIALVAKRDKDGNIIRKPSRLYATI